MQELIALEKRVISEGEVQTVNARDLHAFLEVGKDFSNWIKDRIEQYGFIENQDFAVFAEIGGNPKVGRPSKDYAITLDMAKELAMVERNDKGKQARLYFIECEKRAKAGTQQFPVPTTFVEALRLAAELAEENERQRLALVEQAPKVEFADRHAFADGLFSLRDAAKQIGMPPGTFNTRLMEDGFLFRNGAGNLVPYAKHQQSGLFDVIAVEAHGHARQQTKITAVGIQKLSARYASEV